MTLFALTLCSLLLSPTPGHAEASDLGDWDLRTPEMANSEPAPGKRVRITAPEYEGTEVHHSLYLPVDWKTGALYPVIVEYTGNRWQPSNSTGEIADANLGYGISGGSGFIWVSMPYVAKGGTQNEVTWWGDRLATIDYCKLNLPRICEAYGGDPAKLFICGFSRGAIATSYIGLADDKIAGLWRGFITHDHFDGAKSWNYPESDRASALERLARLRGRPVLVCSQNATGLKRDFLGKHGKLGDFTFLDVPTSRIFSIPEGPVIHPHTDLWMHKPSEYRKAVRKWVRNTCSSDAQDRKRSTNPSPTSK